MPSPYWYKRANSVQDFTELFAERLNHKQWRELTELCRKLNVPTWSCPSEQLPPMDVYIRAEDKDLLE